MRKLLQVFSFFTLLLLFQSSALFAQERTIIGTVFSDSNAPLQGVTVKVKNSNRFSVTNKEGEFKISVSPGEVLELTYVGYDAHEEKVSESASSMSISLKQSTGNLQEVVVTTALGIKQKKKSLGYNVQEISSAELDKGKENNFINALQGKVSGVNITSTGGAAGSGTDIIIRGISSLSPSANNQPLIIIDGLPVNNSTISAGVLPSAGSNGNQAGSNDQFAFANRGLDINPDDVESIAVLKGAGATALYGLQAANGAIIITTKKGKAGKLSISVNSSTSIDFLTKYPEIQTTYREGSNGRINTNFDGSLGSKFQTFGPLRTNNDPVYNNFKNAFTTGRRLNNTITLQGGNNNGTYYSSISALNQDGILKHTGFDRYTFKLAGTYQVSNKLSTSGSATFTSSKTIAPSAGDKGVMTALAYFSPTFDVRDYIHPDGSMKVYAPGIIDNPLYVARFSQLKSNLFRFTGNTGFNYTIIPKLKLDYKIGGDFYGDSRTRIVPGPRYPGDPTTFDLAILNGGYVVEDRVTFREVNSNAILTWEDKISKSFDYSLMAGNTLQVSYTDISNARGERFALPGFYDISNTTTFYSRRYTTNRRYAGVFGSAKLGYKNAVFIDLTARNDWSSTLPSQNNSFFYPSASLSYVFTQLHKISNNILNFGKLRFSYAQVGKDAPAYSIGSYYLSLSDFPFTTATGTSVPGFLRGISYGDPKLKPEMQKSFEIGTELHFFRNRVNLDVSYYSSKNIDQIIPVPISYTSGFSNFITNAGTIQNKGVEVELNVSPIATRNFKWNFILNWSRNRNEVIKIKEGINEISFYNEVRITNKLVVGGSAGDLYGTAYRKDDKGNLLIRADGFPDYTPDFVKVGNAFPDWTGSINNNFTYKDFTFSFLLEYKKGGDVFDVTMRNAIRNGVLKITENRYQQVIFNGIKIADGKANDIPVILDHNYYRNTNFFNNIADIILQDASWLRLRNVNLSYNVPTSIIKKTNWIKGASVGITASNFILWTPYSGYDPSTTAYSAGYNVYGFTGSNIPAFSSMVVNLNINF